MCTIKKYGDAVVPPSFTTLKCVNSILFIAQKNPSLWTLKYGKYLIVSEKTIFILYGTPCIINIHNDSKPAESLMKIISNRKWY